MPEEKGLTREDLEYMLNMAAEKFFKTFNAIKVEPVISINSGSASVEEINKRLAEIVQKSAGAVTGGCYSEDSKPSPGKILKATIHISNGCELVSLLQKAITDLDVLKSDMQKINGFKIKTTITD